MTMFTLKPSEVRKEVVIDLEAGLVPFIQSSPGLGKSALVAQIAKDFGLELIDLRLSQCAPEDLMGLPMRNDQRRAEFVPFSLFPILGDKLPEGKNGWLLFLDEFNSATKSVQAAAYKLALDKMVGMEKLHPECAVVCAGNLATDRAIVTQMSTAMQSRLTHYEMEYDHADFMAHAVPAGFDHRVLGFLEFQPQQGHKFNPDHEDRTFACPRTWEFASRKIKGRPTDEISIAGLAGIISDGVAVEFHTFLKEFDKLPSYASIAAQPDSAVIPPDPSTRYALTLMLLERFDEADFKDVVKYVKRLPPEFQVIYFRGVVQRNPHMRREKDYRAAIQDLTKFINEVDDVPQAA